MDNPIIRWNTWLAKATIGFGLCCVALVLFNGFQTSSYAVLACSASYLVVSLFLGRSASTVGLSVLIFLLPLTPTLSTQLAAVLPNVQLPRALTGAELVAGFLLGFITKQVSINKFNLSDIAPPRILSACLIFLSLSVSVAIARNLWLSGSHFSVEGLIYNFVHFSANGWKDDFFPLTDLLTYGLSVFFIGCTIFILKGELRPTNKVLTPIFLSVIVAGCWAIVQNRTGYGLSYSSASGNRFYQLFGFASTGFQPDIHAFSGHMLLGAVGALGCLLYNKDRINKGLIVSALMLGWIGLWVSKSRGSILLAALAYLVIFALWLWRKNKLYFFASLALTLFIVCAVYILHRWGISVIPLWLIQYAETLPRMHVNNLEALNTHFGNRAEIYLAAVRMFLVFPWFGVGQGEFYKMSGVSEFAKSKFLEQIQGEHAHNYFLQTLAELGLVGAGLCLAIFIIPWVLAKNRRELYPAYIVIFSFALGNVFAHSLLVRENFFLVCVIVALICSASETREHAPNISPLVRRSPWLYIFAAVVIAALTLKEIYSSFDRFPYQRASACQRPAAIKNNEWTTGLIQINGVPGARGVDLRLKDVPPYVAKMPLGLLVEIKDSQQALVRQEMRAITYVGPQIIRIDFPESVQNKADQFSVSVKLSSCFTPRNYGVNRDNRKLGLLLEEIVYR